MPYLQTDNNKQVTPACDDRLGSGLLAVDDRSDPGTTPEDDIAELLANGELITPADDESATSEPPADDDIQDLLLKMMQYNFQQMMLNK